MKKELSAIFNEKVERHKNALLHDARKCQWDTFKIKADNLFDYVESIELSEIARKFFRTFRVIFLVLAFIVIALLEMDFGVSPELLRLKNAIILLAIGGSCFELYFFLDFRMYMENKAIYYKKRKENFIRNIEKDFKNIIIQSECSP